MDTVVGGVNRMNSIFGTFGYVKPGRCSWCYNMIYEPKGKYCCIDCEQEYNDWVAINYYHRNKEQQKQRYQNLTVEQKVEHNRKQSLKRNPNAPIRGSKLLNKPKINL